MKYLLILSFFFIGCKSQNETPYPVSEKVYMTDIVNERCVEYALIDSKAVQFARIQDFPLLPGGPCDHMVGYSRDSIKTVENWARDIQK